MAAEQHAAVAAHPTAAPAHAVRLVLTLVCALASALAAVLVVAPEAHAIDSRTRAVRLAAAQKGDPYRYGAEGPNAFDCSGLTTWVFNRKMGRNLPRTSSAQYAASRHIDKRNVRRGDLVFFSSGGRIYHVGIYAGRHRIWHAPYSGARVRLERIWTTHWRVGRILR